MGLASNIEFFLRLLRARLLKKNVPLVAQFSVTSNCNARCTYCYARYYDRSHQEMSTPDALRVIDELVAAGVQRISLVGGEPLIRKDIDQLVSRIKQHGIECALTSNGLLVEKKLATCKQLDVLSFSLDGREAGHDRNRGAGSFRQTMAAIELAVREGITVQASTVVSKANLQDLDFLVELATRHGFFLTFTPLIGQTTPDGKEPLSELLPTNEEYRSYFNQVIELKRQGAPILFAEKVYAITRDWDDFSRDKIISDQPVADAIPCYAGRHTVLVDATGDVYPCPQLVDVLPVENMLEVGFAQAWAKLHDHQCRACLSPCSNNTNLILGLDPGVITDLVRCYRSNRLGSNSGKKK